MGFDLARHEICSFCQDLAGSRAVGIVAENAHAIAEVDERQYERGAMLVIPRMHRPSSISSGPNRRFLQRDYAVISLEEQWAIADKIRKSL